MAATKKTTGSSRVNWQRKLVALGACSEAVQWAKEYKTFAEAWQACERGDWLLWLTAKMIGKPGWPTHQQIVVAACDCAETALRFVPKGEDRPRVAIETTRKWARGGATLDEVMEARRNCRK